MTRQVLAMEVDGLIERGHDPQDGRATLVTATDRGRQAPAATRTARAELNEKVLADLLTRLNADLDARVRRP